MTSTIIAMAGHEAERPFVERFVEAARLAFNSVNDEKTLDLTDDQKAALYAGANLLIKAIEATDQATAQIQQLAEAIDGPIVAGLSADEFENFNDRILPQDEETQFILHVLRSKPGENLVRHHFNAAGFAAIKPDRTEAGNDSSFSKKIKALVTAGVVTREGNVYRLSKEYVEFIEYKERQGEPPFLAQ